MQTGDQLFFLRSVHESLPLNLAGPSQERPGTEPSGFNEDHRQLPVVRLACPGSSSLMAVAPCGGLETLCSRLCRPTEADTGPPDPKVDRHGPCTLEQGGRQLPPHTLLPPAPPLAQNRKKPRRQ